MLITARACTKYLNSNKQETSSVLGKISSNGLVFAKKIQTNKLLCFSEIVHMYNDTDFRSPGNKKYKNYTFEYNV